MIDKEFFTHLKLNSYEVGLIRNALYAYDVDNAVANGEESSKAIDYKRQLMETLEDRARRLSNRWEIFLHG